MSLWKKIAGIVGVLVCIFTLWEIFFSQGSEITHSENEETIEIKEEDFFEYRIIEPIESLEISKYFKFKSNEEQFSFIYDEFPMHIFGHASSSEMLTFNYLNEFYKQFREDYEIVIISDEVEKSKPSTLFFLSKFGCLIESVVFYNPKTIDKVLDRKSTRLNSSHVSESRMPSSA